MGDIVDRGPDTPGVLEFFRTHPGARALLDQAEIRASRVAGRPAAAWLHLARKERLAPESIKRRLRSPEQARAILAARRPPDPG